MLTCCRYFIDRSSSLLFSKWLSLPKLSSCLVVQLSTSSYMGATCQLPANMFALSQQTKKKKKVKDKALCVCWLAREFRLLEKNDTHKEYIHGHI